MKLINKFYESLIPYNIVNSAYVIVVSIISLSLNYKPLYYLLWFVINDDVGLFIYFPIILFFVQFYIIYTNKGLSNYTYLKIIVNLIFMLVLSYFIFYFIFFCVFYKGEAI